MTEAETRAYEDLLKLLVENAEYATQSQNVLGVLREFLDIMTSKYPQGEIPEPTIKTPLHEHYRTSPVYPPTLLQDTWSKVRGD